MGAGKEEFKKSMVSNSAGNISTEIYPLDLATQDCGWSNFSVKSGAEADGLRSEWSVGTWSLVNAHNMKSKSKSPRS